LCSTVIGTLTPSWLGTSTSVTCKSSGGKLGSAPKATAVATPSRAR
jgi:hypothetical protein